MKKVVSVSLGTSKRDKAIDLSILGEQFHIQRIGCDGDVKRFAQNFSELDGKVDCLGIGGADLHVAVGKFRYTFTSIQRLVSGAKQTPVVDGSGLKHTLERATIEWLQREGVFDFKGLPVLLVSAVDRFGMAQALDAAGAKVVFGDLLFGLGLPFPLRSYSSVVRLGRVILPVIRHLPQHWLYPVGEKQEKRSPKHSWAFDQAAVIAGDWHFIRRYAPERLDGKSVITQTVRAADIEWLRAAGVRRLITTTPLMGGETFATNVMEAVLVALDGRHPEEITPSDYLQWLQRLEWTPQILELDS